MPLRCRTSVGVLNAYEIDTEHWLQLKRDRRDLGLRMTCCESIAIPKVSSLGTQFFAHHRRGPCVSAPETVEHLFAKTIIARAALEAGWTVQTEAPGISPAGEMWIADVLVSNGRGKVAFEVQWSAQTTEETLRRHEQYAASAVRALWLFRQRVFPSSKALPAFHLAIENEDAVVGVPRHASEHPRNAYWTKREGWAQRVPLRSFVTGALARRLRWAPAFGRAFPVSIHCGTTKCWKCGKRTAAIVDIEIDIAAVIEGHMNLHLHVDDLGRAPDVLAALLPRDRLRQAGIGTVKRRFSRTVGHEYLSNGCFYCDALLGKFYEYEYEREALPRLRSTISLSQKLLDELFAEVPEDFFERWWLDTGEVRDAERQGLDAAAVPGMGASDSS